MTPAAVGLVANPSTVDSLLLCLSSASLFLPNSLDDYSGWKSPIEVSVTSSLVCHCGQSPYIDVCSNGADGASPSEDSSPTDSLGDWHDSVCLPWALFPLLYTAIACFRQRYACTHCSGIVQPTWQIYLNVHILGALYDLLLILPGEVRSIEPALFAVRWHGCLAIPLTLACAISWPLPSSWHLCRLRHPCMHAHIFPSFAIFNWIRQCAMHNNNRNDTSYMIGSSTNAPKTRLPVVWLPGCGHSSRLRSCFGLLTNSLLLGASNGRTCHNRVCVDPVNSSFVCPCVLHCIVIFSYFGL